MPEAGQLPHDAGATSEHSWIGLYWVVLEAGQPPHDAGATCYRRLCCNGRGGVPGRHAWVCTCTASLRPPAIHALAHLGATVRPSLPLQVPRELGTLRKLRILHMGGNLEEEFAEARVVRFST